MKLQEIFFTHYDFCVREHKTHVMAKIFVPKTIELAI